MDDFPENDIIIVEDVSASDGTTSIFEARKFADGRVILNINDDTLTPRQAVEMLVTFTKDILENYE